MKRYLGWLISAAFALAVYALLNALGVPQILVLIFTFAGALIGAAVGSRIMQRPQGQAGETPPSPPGRGSGRKAR